MITIFSGQLLCQIPETLCLNGVMRLDSPGYFSLSLIKTIEYNFYAYRWSHRHQFHHRALIGFFGGNDQYIREVDSFFLKEPKNNRIDFVLKSPVILTS